MHRAATRSRGRRWVKDKRKEKFREGKRVRERKFGPSLPISRSVNILTFVSEK